MKNQKRQTGFTLIELMIVIAIIGILMAYAIPAYRDYTIRAKAGECISIMNGAKLGVSERWSATNALPSSNSSAFVSATITGKNVASVAIGANGVITCTYNTADSTLQNLTVVLTPSVSTGSLLWKCDATALPAPVRPSNCDNTF